VYKPVDPGLQARILRMFGQPYDKRFIDPREAHYLNGGWDDDGDGEEALQLKPAPAVTGPFENTGRTQAGWPSRPGTIFPSRGGTVRPLSYQTNPGGASGAGRPANWYAEGGAYGNMTLPDGASGNDVNTWRGGTSAANTNRPAGNQGASSSQKAGFSGYLNKLAEVESRGSGDYQAKSKDGYLGRYQMGAGALVDAGFYNYGEGENSRVNKYNGTWTDKAKAYGIKSIDDFRNNPEAQEAAIREYNKKNWAYIRNGGYDKYIGKVIHGIPVTASGLLAVCHLLGPGGVGQLFGEEGPYDVDENGVPVDGNGTPATKYLGDMKGLDLTDLLDYNPDKE
jgi:hypothetical protein